MNLKFQTILNTPSKEASDLPFYPLLPKDKVGLLKWRLYARQRALVDGEFRNMLWHMAGKDVAFFAATFVYCHETREGEFAGTQGKFPFVPWCDQIDLLAWLQKYGGKTDICWEKTRGIGASWVICIYLIWKWLFSTGGHIELGVLSKDKLALDVPSRPSTLMGKLDIIFENLPAWMRMDETGKSILHRTHTHHRFEHRISGNAILGYTPSDEKLRGARLALLVLDEAAFLEADEQKWLDASHYVSPSRIWISTHSGTANMFYRLSINTKAKLVRISTWWQANPARAKGMYRSTKGQIELLDKSYKYPIDYFNQSFVHDMPNLERSPWVDSELLRAGVNVDTMKQELYGVAALDSSKVFQKNIIDIARSTCTKPAFIGDFDGKEWSESLEGCFRVWKPIDALNSTYTVAIDPALSESGGDNAAMSVVDLKTGEQVITYRNNKIGPVDLARLAADLGNYLAGPRGSGFARIIYESTGIGVAFSNELFRLRYSALFQPSDKKTPGIHNRDAGDSWYIELGRAIRDGDIVIRDSQVVSELEDIEYIKKIKGNDVEYEVVYAGTDGHADLAMSTAIAWQGAKERIRANRASERPLGHQMTREPKYKLQKARKYRWSDRFGSV